jgi:hypothetical protein
MAAVPRESAIDIIQKQLLKLYYNRAYYQQGLVVKLCALRFYLCFFCCV